MVSILFKNECNPSTAINILIYFVCERDQTWKWFIKLNFSVAIRASLSGEVKENQGLYSGLRREFEFSSSKKFDTKRTLKTKMMESRDSLFEELAMVFIS